MHGTEQFFIFICVLYQSVLTRLYSSTCTRDKDLRRQKSRFKYDMRKFCVLTIGIVCQIGSLQPIILNYF